jgi:hypothetical protein
VSLAAATFALGATQAVTSHIAGAENYQNNADAVRSSVGTTWAFQQKKINDERAAGVNKNIGNSIETMKAAATARAAAGEAGVHGLSVDAIEGEFYAKQGRFSEAVDQNYNMQRSLMIGEMEATRSKGQSQINAVKNPELLDTGLAIIGSALSAGTGYVKMSK